LFHNKNFYFQIQTKIPLSWMVLVAIAFGQNPPVFDCPLSQVDFVAVNMSLAPSVGPAGYDSVSYVAKPSQEWQRVQR
jgi:hypothetical protein